MAVISRNAAGLNPIQLSRAPLKRGGQLLTYLKVNINQIKCNIPVVILETPLHPAPLRNYLTRRLFTIPKPCVFLCR